MGVLTSRVDRREELCDALVARWGPVDFSCPPFPFTFTTYYDREMGTPIWRFFLSFQRLVDPSHMAALKRETNSMEERYREDGRRKVNLDPGLLSLSRFVLATTKDNAHRIPLENGIYAEVTLLYHKGGYQPLPWTYPDFRSERYLAILNQVGALYRSQLGSR